MRAPSVFAVLALLVVCAAAQARADDRSIARQHFQKGSKAFDLGFYDEAIREYMAAYQSKEDPAILYNLAQAHRLAGHSADALRFYRIYLTKIPDASNREEVERKINELQKVVEEQKNAQPKPPPEHPIKLAAPEAPPAPEPALPKRAVVDQRAGRTKRISGISVAGAGIVCLAVGIAFGVLAQSASDELTSIDRNRLTFDSAKDSNGRLDQILEAAFLGIGAAAVIGGTVLFILGRRESSARRLSVAPLVTNHEVRLVAEVRF